MWGLRFFLTNIWHKATLFLTNNLQNHTLFLTKEGLFSPLFLSNEEKWEGGVGEKSDFSQSDEPFIIIKYVLLLKYEMLLGMETYSTSFTNCWKAANQLSNNDKLKLIAMLSSSMERSEKLRNKADKDALVDSLYGAWSDQDFPDSDEINSELRSSRRTNRDILELI